MDKNMSLELLTRYEPDISCGPPCCGTMAESSKGEYVKFSDVERLLAAPSAAQVQASNITNQQANDEKQTRADDQGHAQDAQDDAGAVGAGGRAGADQYNEHREGQSGNQHGNAGRNCGSSGVSGEVSVRAGEVGAAPSAAAPAAPEQNEVRNQAQVDATMEAINQACGSLPVGYEVILEMESGAGGVVWTDDEGERHVIDGERHISQDIHEAVRCAIEHAAMKTAINEGEARDE